MDPVSIATTGVGLLGSILSPTPEWQDVTFHGVDANRYGFQGVYQKFLQSENQRLKDDESRRIMKLASGLVPGAASYRSGLAAQGLDGGISNVIAKQQREQSMGRALDTGLSEYDRSVGGLNSQFLQMAGQSEAMYNQATQFNAEGQLRADIANSQGRMGAQQASSEKWQGLFGGITSAGASMMGQEMGMQKYWDLKSKYDQPTEDIEGIDLIQNGRHFKWNEKDGTLTLMQGGQF